MPSLLHARIVRVRDEAIDIKSFDLEVPGLDELPAWTPGAHIDTTLAPGTVRQYSLCGEPGARDRYRIAVKREPASRGGSSGWHARRVGESVLISEPRNHFPLAAQAARHVLVAGGIGITPLLSMARHLHASGTPFELHYFSRSAAHAAFADALADLGSFTCHFGIEPTAMSGYLDGMLQPCGPLEHLYVCGPRPFMDAVQARAVRDRPAASIHLEHFTPKPCAAEAAGDAFRVRIASTGQEWEVPSDRSVLQVLAAHGIAIDSSCGQGVCGTCLTGVLEGIPDHRDEVLGDAARKAGNLFAPCVSRALSPLLVLDL